MDEEKFTKRSIFSRKRNFSHMKLKGIIRNIESITGCPTTTPGEIAQLNSLISKIAKFNTNFFSTSSRELAEEYYNGI